MRKAFWKALRELLIFTYSGKIPECSCKLDSTVVYFTGEL